MLKSNINSRTPQTKLPKAQEKKARDPSLFYKTEKKSLECKTQGLTIMFVVVVFKVYFQFPVVHVHASL
jgi:hypothetical protein